MSIPEPCLCGAWDCPRCYPGEKYDPGYDDDDDYGEDYQDEDYSGNE